MSRVINQAPDPRSHIKTLMRIGYTLNSAVADIVDNSIAANAKNIEIFSPPTEESPFISILDDGCGMTFDELIQNMRIGCKDPADARNTGDLGRFGSGMKTASFSQARQLTVISKKQGDALAAARWDIDQIEETNTWCLEVLEGPEIHEVVGISQKLIKNGGTQIIWGKLTCLETSSHSADYQSQLAASLSELKSYIALHFHRFMRGKDKRSFLLNSVFIDAIDPFMTDEVGYQEGPSANMRCKGGRIAIQTHVLPHIQNMDPKRLEALGGAESITRDQGIYLYRERRLISAGGWMGMGSNSQLSALARVQVDVPSTLDNDWSTDVKKASLQM